jgi:beta-lactamase class A
MDKNCLSNKSAMMLFWLAVLSLFVFYFVWHKNLSASDIFCKKYSFLNSDIVCDYKYVMDKKEYTDLRSKLSLFIDNSKSRGKASLVAVWFRDLKYGPTFGIHDRVDFIPASLLKLPLAMTYFEMAENDPSLLKRKIEYSNPNPAIPNQIFVPTKSIKEGQSYSIEELIEYMIVYSDNNASQLLYDYLKTDYPNENPLADTMRDLGILGSGSDIYLSSVNTKEYGSIFRLLFNASYLNKENSEKLLSILARSEFKDGLNAGVPENVVVVHKFGERYLDSGERQLHDCGIIYFPGNPYQLCVMTRGTNYDDLKGIIKEISKEVYQEVDSRKIKTN